MSLKDKKAFKKQEKKELKGILAEFRQAVEEEKQEILLAAELSRRLLEGQEVVLP